MGVCDIPGGILPNHLRNAKGQTGLFPDPGYVSSQEDLPSLWMYQPKRCLRRLSSQGGL